MALRLGILVSSSGESYIYEVGEYLGLGAHFILVFDIVFAELNDPFGHSSVLTRAGKDVTQGLCC